MDADSLRGDGDDGSFAPDSDAAELDSISDLQLFWRHPRWVLQQEALLFAQLPDSQRQELELGFELLEVLVEEGPARRSGHANAGGREVGLPFVVTDLLVVFVVFSIEKYVETGPLLTGGWR